MLLILFIYILLNFQGSLSPFSVPSICEVVTCFWCTQKEGSRSKVKSRKKREKFIQSDRFVKKKTEKVPLMARPQWPNAPEFLCSSNLALAGASMWSEVFIDTDGESETAAMSAPGWIRAVNGFMRSFTVPREDPWKGCLLVASA